MTQEIIDAINEGAALRRTALAITPPSTFVIIAPSVEQAAIDDAYTCFVCSYRRYGRPTEFLICRGCLKRIFEDETYRPELPPYCYLPLLLKAAALVFDTQRRKRLEKAQRLLKEREKAFTESERIYDAMCGAGMDNPRDEKLEAAYHRAATHHDMLRVRFDWALRKVHEDDVAGIFSRMRFIR